MRKEEEKKKMAKVIGIDLGTTHSAMAVVDETGRPKIVMNSEGKSITPSVALFRAEDVVVGERAKRAAIAEKDNVAMFVKRHMCEPDWEFIDGKEGVHRPEEVAALILKKLKQDAERQLGDEVKEAVITVPAYFQDMERNRTKTAGELAGLNVLRIINEPTAAAIAYGLESMGHEELAMVYDLGGGTFDITIIKVADQKIQVVTSDGNKFLGGVDFDNALVEYFSDQFNEKHGIDPTKDLRTYQDFYSRAEEAKIDLSADTMTYVSLSAAGKTMDIELTREQFEDLIRPRLQNTLDLTQESLEAAAEKLGKTISWNDIDTMLLVGGSTRIPLVQKMVEELTGKPPQVGINPDEVVAMGASIIAAQGVGKPVVDANLEALPSLEIRDVTAHSLGVIAIDTETDVEYNSIIIPKDSEVPAQKSEMYTTIVNNQTDIRITVLQGEDRNPKYCTLIGKEDGYVLSGIPPMLKGVPEIEHTMSYDKEGFVLLTAKELSSGKKLDIEIENPSLLTKKQKEEIAKKVAGMTVR
jgi:molecular chaperone DnaK